MNYRFDPLDRRCKSIRGAVASGEDLTFRLFAEEGGEGNFSADACLLELYEDGGKARFLPMEKDETGFFITVRIHRIGLYFYRFSFGEVKLGRGEFRRGLLGGDPACWQLTVYEAGFSTPSWFKGGVMYQIFPDRFCRVGTLPAKPWKIVRDDWGGQPNFRPNVFGKVLNNDFFGGNFAGIVSKLGYLKELGVTALYLNPICEAYSNHRYDTGDYMHVDGLLGTDAQFKELCEKANAIGIRVILDGVFNHTGDDSRYFNKYGRYDSLGAYQSPASPYAEWYDFQNYPDTYTSWWGVETLPAVNERSESYQNFILGDGGVVKTWLGRGASGYRLDVADELPDFFLERLRTAMKEADPDAIVIGEVWEDASNKISYDVRRHYLQGRELDSVMNYPLKNAVIDFVKTGDTRELRETLFMLIDNYPKETLDCLMNLLSTHDTPRILTVLGGKECADKEEMSVTRLSPEEYAYAREKLKMAALLEYTLPGVPCLYYGDEAGMEGYLDPFCRACFPWDNIDASIRDFYVKLGRIRTQDLASAFRTGEYGEIFADRHCLVFERREKDARAIVFCNNGTGEYVIDLGEGLYRELLGGNTVSSALRIGPYGYGILTKE